MIYKGFVKGNMVILDSSVKLKDGTKVKVVPVQNNELDDETIKMLIDEQLIKDYQEGKEDIKDARTVDWKSIKRDV